MIGWIASALAACPMGSTAEVMQCLGASDPAVAACASHRRSDVEPVTLSWTVVDGRANALSIDSERSELAACVAARLPLWEFPAELAGPRRWTFVFHDSTLAGVVTPAAPVHKPLLASQAAIFIDSEVPVRIIDAAGNVVTPETFVAGDYDLYAVFEANEVVQIGSINAKPGDRYQVRCASGHQLCKIQRSGRRAP